MVIKKQNIQSLAKTNIYPHTWGYQRVRNVRFCKKFCLICFPVTIILTFALCLVAKELRKEKTNIIT